MIIENLFENISFFYLLGGTMKRMNEKRTGRMRGVLVVLMAISFVSFAFGYSHEITIKRTYPINPDGEFRLKTIRGDINLSTHSENEVSVKAILMAEEKSELDGVDLDFETEAGSVTLSTGNKIAKSKIDIQYYLKVPENLKSVTIITFNGQIDLRGVYRDIDLRAANGDIEFRGDFSGCRLKAANGDIDVDVRNVLKGNITGESGNGSIRVRLTPDSDFAIEGSTRTGIIRSDFETTITDAFIGSGIKGTVGKGAYQVKLKVVNGDISIRKQ
jgi:DUF4097 and DUF4098 domain-containing protein YvlB